MYTSHKAQRVEPEAIQVSGRHVDEVDMHCAVAVYGCHHTLPPQCCLHGGHPAAALPVVQTSG